MVRFSNLLLSASMAAAIALGDDGPCCNTCVEPLEKYYSIDKIHNMCGECCMDPKKYAIYKIFEPGLTKATDNTPCKDNKYSGYDSTVTHGFGPIKMTLDLYKPDSEEKASDDTPPHLSQAWVALSTGDGEPGATGKESYLYEDCKESSDTCVKAHVWDYGANNCIKFEVDRGFSSKYSGTFYVACDAVDCCKSAGTEGPIPDIKKWDIGQAGALLQDKVTYLGKKDTTELGGNPVKSADAWFEQFDLPFTTRKINYTYYVTESGDDVITHRINYGGGDSKSTGNILYGDFQVQKNISSFRNVFEPPAACLKNNVLTCSQKKVKAWNKKYFKHAAARNGWFDEA